MNTMMSTLARQIEIARNHAALEQRKVDSDPAIEAILRSLRITYLALSRGLDPWKDAQPLFVLTVSETGESFLSHAGSVVPVNEPFLAYLFWTAGIDLLPGQYVFLEPELAKAAIEEALGRLALEQAFAEREWASRRAVMETSLSLPRREEIDLLRSLEDRTNLLWDRKIELVAASLIADESLDSADPETEAA